MILNPNANITIYNKYYDHEDDIEKYQRTIIENVNWQNKREGAVSDKGLLLTNSTLIFIDVLDNYVSPKKFRSLDPEDRKNYFTLGIGDRIVKDSIEFNVTGRKPYAISNLEEEFDNVVSILTVSEFSTHLEVGCK